MARRFTDLKGKTISRIRAGSAFKVQITVRTNQTLLHLDVEDPIPAGCEPIDETLNTSQQGLAPPSNSWSPFTGAVLDLSWYLQHVDLRDDRVSLYSYSLPPGTYRYSYLAQATVPGTYTVAPTHASEAFFPEVFGRSAGQIFKVG